MTLDLITDITIVTALVAFAIVTALTAVAGRVTTA